MKEKIELGQIFCGEYSEDCQVDRLQCPFGDCMAEEWAEKILSLGYHKTIWHKVADDYPEEEKYVLCFTEYNEMHVWKLRRVGGAPYWADSEDHYHGHVVAWTELPKYKE